MADGCLPTAHPIACVICPAGSHAFRSVFGGSLDLATAGYASRHLACIIYCVIRAVTTVVLLKQQMRTQDSVWSAFLRRLRQGGCSRDD